jgi:hypothetical protein
MYEKQLGQLEALGRVGGDLEAVAQIAQMGASPGDRVMLVLRALWASPRAVPRLPPVLVRRTEAWLQEALDDQLHALWQETLSQRVQNPGGTV